VQKNYNILNVVVPDDFKEITPNYNGTHYQQMCYRTCLRVFLAGLGFFSRLPLNQDISSYFGAAAVTLPPYTHHPDLCCGAHHLTYRAN
jgi:hypothetical protein